jgi:hypothetical protein
MKKSKQMDDCTQCHISLVGLSENSQCISFPEEIANFISEETRKERIFRLCDICTRITINKFVKHIDSDRLPLYINYCEFKDKTTESTQEGLFIIKGLPPFLGNGAEYLNWVIKEAVIKRLRNGL